jgi:hypothetical protein
MTFVYCVFATGTVTGCVVGNDITSGSFEEIGTPAEANAFDTILPAINPAAIARMVIRNSWIAAFDI